MKQIALKSRFFAQHALDSESFKWTFITQCGEATSNSGLGDASDEQIRMFATEVGLAFWGSWMLLVIEVLQVFV